MPWNFVDTLITGHLVTAAEFDEVAENLQFLEEVAYVEFTSDVSVTATTVATANQIVTTGPITLEAVPHLLEFYSPRVTVGTAQAFIIVRDGTTRKGTLANMTGGADATNPFYAPYRFTPTAASHTYNVAGWVASASTTTVTAGSGGSAGDASTRMPGFIRLTRVPT
jgi:hypothetical protein